MDVLEDEGYINTDTRTDLLLNTLTLIAAAEMADDVTMDNLIDDEIGLIAIGEPETVPAGKYASQTFDSMGITADLEGKIVFAKDVRAVLNYVESGDADCGFVYRTDAMMLDAECGVIIGDVSEKLHDPVVYPAAILAEAPQADAAADFYTFMQSDFAKEIYGKYGFTVK
jgi:molybdate transport system substrate-binding protein